MRKLLAVIFLFISTTLVVAQNVNGRITEKTTGVPVPFAKLSCKGGTFTSDTGGLFSLNLNGGKTVSISANDFVETTLSWVGSTFWEIKVESVEKNMGSVNITHDRLKEKMRESPVTVESLNAKAIKQTPASDFYEGLGHLRGVDVTAASMGFRIINTRGFNSTSPVRSLQIIDGVDNQAPGLNFSLGNFLGSSELDVANTEIVVGASSAYYGPNAFNGVISMTTKDPWKYQGLSAQVKVGERQLGQLMIRYAKAYKNKKGVDKFAWKANISYMRAYDWVADNMDPVTGSISARNNPGSYNAVNRYGDETIQDQFTSVGLRYSDPGVEIFNRNGYVEKDIVNYNARNFKSALLLCYKLNAKNEIQIASNFGTGTTVYQGDNRYSLNDILFFQNRIELKGNNGFLRMYATNEDAGKTYDAVLTALQLQNMVKKEGDWLSEYQKYFTRNYRGKVVGLPFYPKGDPLSNPNWVAEYEKCMAANRDILTTWHNATRQAVDKAGSAVPPFGYNYNTYDFFQPGTSRFDSMKAVITNARSFSTKGELAGSKFFDKSAMYHFAGEKRFSIRNYKITSGFSSRMYRPYSMGTVFLDMTDRIVNVEAGAYAGVEKRFYKNRFKTNATVRVDKNQNFNFLVSPAFSLVYSKTKRNTYRASISSALRNPTLQDQYLHYNVGRAILLGNLNGIKNVTTTENFLDYLHSLDPSKLKLFNIAPIRPEQVRTIEAAYKGLVLNSHLAVDAGLYYSIYHNFIGYKLIVAEIDIDSQTNFPLSYQVYRVATNSVNKVSTQGFSIGLNYFFWKVCMLSGNWSWNQLDRKGIKDALIPAFNTPTNKFNLGIGAAEMTSKLHLGNRTISLEHFSFNINYKWIQGYRFEGSPQFTGDVPTYWLLDAQVSKSVPRLKSTFKLGASNLTNNMVFQVYGGPRIGRMAYFSATIEL